MNHEKLKKLGAKILLPEKKPFKRIPLKDVLISMGEKEFSMVEFKAKFDRKKIKVTKNYLYNYLCRLIREEILTHQYKPVDYSKKYVTFYKLNNPQKLLLCLE